MATQTLVLPEHIYTGWVGSSYGHDHLIKLIFLVIPQGTSFKKKTQQTNKKQNPNPTYCRKRHFSGNCQTKYDYLLFIIFSCHLSNLGKAICSLNKLDPIMPVQLFSLLSFVFASKFLITACNTFTFLHSCLYFVGYTVFLLLHFFFLSPLGNIIILHFSRFGQTEMFSASS